MISVESIMQMQPFTAGMIGEEQYHYLLHASWVMAEMNEKELEKQYAYIKDAGVKAWEMGENRCLMCTGCLSTDMCHMSLLEMASLVNAINYSDGEDEHNFPERGAVSVR